MKPISVVIVVAIASGSGVRAEELCDLVKGAVLLAQDDTNTYLGKLASPYDSESIFNEYGTYGSQYN